MLRSVFAVLLALLVIAGQQVTVAQDQPPMIDLAASLNFDEPIRDLAITPDAHHVYVITESGALHGFTFDGETGELTVLDGFPLQLAGISYRPMSLDVDSGGLLVYVAHEGAVGRSLLTPVTILSRSPVSGMLTVISQFSLPIQGMGGFASIRLDPTGRFVLIGDNGSNTIRVVRVALPQILPTAPIANPQEPQVLPPAPDNLLSMTLEPYKVFCSGVGPQLCYIATIEGEQQFFYSQIEGFTYQWGVRYELIVRTDPVTNAPADSSSIRYTLESVVSETPVTADATFEITIPPSVIQQAADGSYSVLGELNFVCSGLGCELLPDLLTATDPIALVMRYPTEAGAAFEARLQVER